MGAGQSTSRRACVGFNRVYQRRVLRSYLRASRLKGHLPALAARLPALARVRTSRDFDGVITAPLHGFTDAEDSYRRCSSQRFLSSVRTPLLILNAADDPLVAPDTLPRPGALTTCVRLELTGRGGHLGFLGRAEGAWDPFVPPVSSHSSSKDPDHEPLFPNAVGAARLEVEARHARGSATQRA